MTKETFKILRCKCGWQRWHEEPIDPPPLCERCSAQAKYSDDWYIKVLVDGKRQIRKVAPQKRKAEQILNRTKEDIIHDKFLRPRQGTAPPLSEAIENVWRDKWKKNKDGNKSKKRAERFIDLVGDHPLDQIDEATWKNAVYYMEGQGIGPGTLNRYRSSIKTVLRRHKIDYSWLEMDTEEEGRIRVLNHDEEDAVIRHILDPKLRHWPKRQNYRDEAADIVVVLVDTGMRPNEVLGLEQRDINFRSELITTWINKTGKPRSVPMTDRVKDILQKRKDLPRPFTINIHQLGNAWEAARKAMNLMDDEDFVPYALRHTCATRLLEAGEDIYTVKEWLGHKTIVTTMKYLHMDPKRLMKAGRSLQGHRQQFVNKDANTPESHITDNT